MGGGCDAPNFLDETPNAENMIYLEDDYIRHHTAQTPEDSVTKLLLPIWRIRSHYRDTIIPIRANILEVQNIKPLILAGSAALSNGCMSHPGIKIIISEAAQSIRVYTTYLFKLRSLKTSIEYIFHSYALHAQQMLEKFRQEIDTNNMYSADYSHRIICAMEMCLLLRSALNDSFCTGQNVLNCALDNLKEMTNYHFDHGVSLPSFDALGYSIMKSYWKVLEGEEKLKKEKQDKNLSLSENVGSSSSPEVFSPHCPIIELETEASNNTEAGTVKILHRRRSRGGSRGRKSSLSKTATEKSYKK